MLKRGGVVFFFFIKRVLIFKNILKGHMQGRMFLLDDNLCSIFRNIFSIERLIIIYTRGIDLFTQGLSRQGKRGLQYTCVSAIQFFHCS